MSIVTLSIMKCAGTHVYLFLKEDALLRGTNSISKKGREHLLT